MSYEGPCVCVCVLHFGLSLLLNGGSFNSSSRVDSFMRTPRLCKLILNQINISYVTTLVFVTRGWHLIYPVSSTYEVNICYSTVYLSYSIGVYQYIDVISLTIIRSKFLLFFLFKVTGCAFGPHLSCVCRRATHPCLVGDNVREPTVLLSAPAPCSLPHRPSSVLQG